MKWVFAQNAQNDGVAPYGRAERPANTRTANTVSGEPLGERVNETGLT